MNTILTLFILLGSVSDHRGLGYGSVTPSSSLTGLNGGTIDNNINNLWCFAENGEIVCMDFSTANEIHYSSSTGVVKYVLDSMGFVVGGDIDLNKYDLITALAPATDTLPDASMIKCGQDGSYLATAAGPNQVGGLCTIDSGIGQRGVACTSFGATADGDTLTITVVKDGVVAPLTLTAKNGGAGAGEWNCETSTASCCTALNAYIVAHPIAGLTSSNATASYVTFRPNQDTNDISVVIAEAGGGGAPSFGTAINSASGNVEIGPYTGSVANVISSPTGVTINAPFTLNSDLNMNGYSVVTTNQDLPLNPGLNGNTLIVTQDEASYSMIGNLTKRGSAVNFASAGTAVLAKALHGIASITAGDLLQITDCTTAADEGIYTVATSDANSITLTETLSGTDADVDVVVYGGVYVAYGENIFNNSETPTPTELSTYQTWKVPPYNTTTENTAAYCKLDHRNPALADFIYCLYFENDADQNLAGGAPIKIMQRGNGDGAYIAIIGDNVSGYGYEAAMFGGETVHGSGVYKQENGFLASFQGSGGFGESVKVQENSVGFHMLVHDDGTNPKNPTDWNTNYGLFYANNALNNAFVDRVSEFATAGFAHFKLMDHDQNPFWEIYDDGQQHMHSLPATAGVVTRDSPIIMLEGSYWDAGAAHETTIKIQNDVNTQVAATASNLNFSNGTPGAEHLICVLDETGFDMQGHNLANVGIIATAEIRYPVSTVSFVDAGGNAEFVYSNGDFNVNDGYAMSYDDAGGIASYVDDLGLHCTQRSSDIACADTQIIAKDAYSLSSGANRTGGDLYLSSGEGANVVQITNFANCAGDTVTITIGGTANVLTEGVSWTAAGSNNDTATSLGSAVDALTGVGATVMTAYVGVNRDSRYPKPVTVANSDATCATSTNNTNGVIRLPDGSSTVLTIQTATSTNSGLYLSATNSGICSNGWCSHQLSSGGWQVPTNIYWGGAAAALIGPVTGPPYIIRVTGTSTNNYPTWSWQLDDSKGADGSFKTAGEALTCDGGGSATLTTSAAFIPDGAFILAIYTRVSTALTGPTTGYSVGISGGDIDLWGVNISNNAGTETGPADYTDTFDNYLRADQAVTITFTGPACTAGVVRVGVQYFLSTGFSAN